MRLLAWGSIERLGSCDAFEHFLLISFSFVARSTSPDPNQLFALLQVFPYHTDTILQMGEVYRQQAGSFSSSHLPSFSSLFVASLSLTLSPRFLVRFLLDLSQASEYIDRALFAFERAFAPGFNIAQGNVRLDFDRVENRGFYLALIRNLQCVRPSFHPSSLLGKNPC